MAWNANAVVEVDLRGGRRVFVRFDDGLKGELDLSGYCRRDGVFAALEDPGFFKQVCIEGGTLAWPNGADIAPETVYELLEGEVLGG
jgi:hypothetical protein